MGKSIFFKIMISLIISILLISIFCFESSYAIGDMISDGKDFLEKGKDPYDYIKKDTLSSVSDKIYNVLLAFAIIIAVIVAMILGIQFMWASAEEKAKVKEALMPFVVGCVVVFGSFTIWKVAVNIGNTAEGDLGGYNDAFEASKATSDITDGKLDINTLTKAQIKDLYTNNRISSNLRDKMYGTAYNPKTKDEYLSLDDALKEIGDTARQIYYKALEYELLREDENGRIIYLINE